ncbi:MAG: SH3 domain-containing protein [Lachnospiraceae bacterium]|nr:SH3 domain-containing protein [Lachnospiraceae bacterium]
MKKIINILVGGYCIVSILAIIYFSFFAVKVTNVSVIDVAFSSAPVATVETLIDDENNNDDNSDNDNNSDGNDDNNNKEPEVSFYRFKAIHGKGALHVRKGPSPSYEVISTVKPGTEGIVITKGGLWSRVTVNNVEGYIFNHYMEFIPVY